MPLHMKQAIRTFMYIHLQDESCIFHVPQAVRENNTQKSENPAYMSTNMPQCMWNVKNYPQKKSAEQFPNTPPVML